MKHEMIKQEIEASLDQLGEAERKDIEQWTQ